jgi:hypothetical protein
MELVEWRHDRETARGERRQGTAKHHVQDATCTRTALGRIWSDFAMSSACWSHVHHKK